MDKHWSEILAKSHAILYSIKTLFVLHVVYTARHQGVLANLHRLFLESECVDNPNSPGPARKFSNVIVAILPPRCSEVVVPIRAWEWRRYVNESAIGAIGSNATSHWVNVSLDL